MSGHSKWSTIKHKKGAADAKRSQIFSKHAKMIFLEAKRGGGDLEMNPTLRMMVEKAKKDNMPNDNITKAIKKGTGELKDATVIEELTYEGYGPGGIACIIWVATDNKNRTVASIRSIFTKNGGNLGEKGSVAWMFNMYGEIIIPKKDLGINNDDLEMLVLESGAEDFKIDEEEIIVYTDRTELFNVKKYLEENDLNIDSAELAMIPENKITVDAKNEDSLMRLYEALDDDDDVLKVFLNVEGF